MQIERLALSPDLDSGTSSQNPGVAIQVYRDPVLVPHGFVFQLAGLNTMQELRLALFYSRGMCVGEIICQEFFQSRDVTVYKSFDPALLRETQFLFL